MRRLFLRLPPAARTAKAAMLAGLLSLPLLGALIYALGPAEIWYGSPNSTGPNSPIIDEEARPQTLQRQESQLAAAAESDSQQPAVISRNLRVASGDTLMAMLTDAGVARQEAYEAITALSDVFSPRSLRPGQEIRLDMAADTAGAKPRLLALNLQPDVERDIRVTRSESDGFIAETVARPLQDTIERVAGTIKTNLSADAYAAGVPPPVLIQLIRIFSFDVDFQRDIQSGDRFEVLFDAKLEEDGSLAKTGDVRYVAMTLSGKRIELYGFTPKSGTSDFFDAKGHSVRKTLMRTPVDGARLTSGFGMRVHPILGYTRLHKGNDFAAPRGTPVYAAGDGTIRTAGRKGSLGNYVRIRHNATYNTAYAHMDRIAKGIRSGTRVKQGQTIGYVGSTGRSTGSHLHYEVLVNGKQVNPTKVKLASGEKLKGTDLEQFGDQRAEVDALRGTGPVGTQTVNAD